jgi:hypothetical protein
MDTPTVAQGSTWRSNADTTEATSPIWRILKLESARLFMDLKPTLLCGDDGVMQGAAGGL